MHSKLKRHIASVHNDTVKIACPRNCGLFLRDRWALKHHLEKRKNSCRPREESSRNIRMLDRIERLQNIDDSDENDTSEIDPREKYHMTINNNSLVLRKNLYKLV